MHKRRDGLTASPQGSNHDIKQRHGAEKGIPTVRMGRFKGPDAEPLSKCTTEHSTGDRVTHQIQVMPFHEAPNLGKEATCTAIIKMTAPTFHPLTVLYTFFMSFPFIPTTILGRSIISVCILQRKKLWLRAVKSQNL